MPNPKNQIEVLENGNIRITMPMIFKICGARKQIITPDSENVETAPILVSIARAYRWQKMIDEGKFKNIAELAQAVGIDSGAIARTIRLTLLSPKIVHKLITGEINLTQESLRQSFPESWSEQEEFFLKSRANTLPELC